MKGLEDVKKEEMSGWMYTPDVWIGERKKELSTSISPDKLKRGGQIPPHTF